MLQNLNIVIESVSQNLECYYFSDQETNFSISYQISLSQFHLHFLSLTSSNVIKGFYATLLNSNNIKSVLWISKSKE